jgi:hypothetical protein
VGDGQSAFATTLTSQLRSQLASTWHPPSSLPPSHVSGSKVPSQLPSHLTGFVALPTHAPEQSPAHAPEQVAAGAVLAHVPAHEPWQLPSARMPGPVALALHVPLHGPLHSTPVGAVHEPLHSPVHDPSHRSGPASPLQLPLHEIMSRPPLHTGGFALSSHVVPAQVPWHAAFAGTESPHVTGVASTVSVPPAATLAAPIAFSAIPHHAVIFVRASPIASAAAWSLADAPRSCARLLHDAVVESRAFAAAPA